MDGRIGLSPGQVSISPPTLYASEREGKARSSMTLCRCGYPQRQVNVFAGYRHAVSETGLSGVIVVLLI
jgi:hypothetical protein